MSEETIIRTAVVTGGSRGIGRAVCIQLAKQGCNVVVNYCHGEAAAAETVALCKTENANAVAVQADVSTAEGCKALFEQAVNAFGRVDILVNNAGITRDNLILRMSEEDFDAVLNANLKGAFLCCKEAARRMVRQRWGRIVNLSSVVALRGNAGQTNYAASKAGLIGLTKSLARELASRNVTVNAVAPGFIETDMTAALPEAVRAEMAKGIPAGRAGGCGKCSGIFCRRTKLLSHRAGALCRRRHGNVKGENSHGKTQSRDHRPWHREPAGQQHRRQLGRCQSGQMRHRPHYPVRYHRF